MVSWSNILFIETESKVRNEVLVRGRPNCINWRA